jgi:hypothetical protein
VSAQPASVVNARVVGAVSSTRACSRPQDVRPGDGGYWQYPATVVAVAVVFGFLCYADAMAPIRHRSVLISACVLIWLPTHGDYWKTIRDIITAYLCCIPVNQVLQSFVRFSVSCLNANISVSCALLVLVILGCGYSVDVLRSRNSTYRNDPSSMFPAAAAAVAVLLLHIAASFALTARYGVTYTHSLRILGSISLFTLLLRACWRTLRQPMWGRFLRIVASTGSLLMLMVN